MAEASADKGRVVCFKRRQGRRVTRLHAEDPAVAAAAEAVATACGFSLEQLVQPNRGAAALALARQVAMYLAHTLLGRQMGDVGTLFGRDRTTVAHACAVIEDRREQAGFDEWVGHLEALVGGEVEERDRVAS